MTMMKYRMTWQLAIAVILVIVIGTVPVILYFIDYQEVFFLITGYVLGWIVLVLIALMGAFLLGMAIGHRIASKSEFTPFEVEMMKMKEEVLHLKEILHRHNIHHKDDKEKEGPKKGGKETPLVEEEPELKAPAAPGPDLKPVGKVKCRKCGGLIPLYSKKRPLDVKCTSCGKQGVLR